MEVAVELSMCVSFCPCVPASRSFCRDQKVASTARLAILEKGH